MNEPRSTTIVNVGYRSTNVWVISRGRSRLMLDLGYPGTMGLLRANLKRMDIPLDEIRYGLATHYHMDHAGLAQELKLAGMTLIVVETQVTAIPELKRWMKPEDHYLEISTDGNLIIPTSESRSILSRAGFSGEVLSTPGHSDDSVSLVLDDGSAFTGDLTWPEMATEDAGAEVAASWRRLAGHGAKRVYPGHGPIRPMPNIITG
jgi:glyoxylase-like metal-dependent hydrolase (beta-lactamase superfamily II)